MHDGKQSGVFVDENGQGTVEDCDIFGNASAGVIIQQGSNPTIRRCKIYAGNNCGVFVRENGQGIVENCDIFGNAYAGVVIKQGGNPTIHTLSNPRWETKWCLCR
ncbi:right-handed parallel beta-helix repeat-containing protein [[Phormidium] sp. ETS-05]|uniref:right-handed parallel beta-helix repeat-containing protein n=1 Tax=[Phormidium] sp. ETS-05 TaxID=222819 RepID=UPI0018EF2385